MTLIPCQSAISLTGSFISLHSSISVMEPEARVNSLNSLALNVLDSNENKQQSDQPTTAEDPKPSTTSFIISASSSRKTSASKSNNSNNDESFSSPELTVSPSKIKINVHQAPKSISSSTSSVVSAMPVPLHRSRGQSNPAPLAGRRKSWDQRFAGPIRRASQVLINLANPDGTSLHGECSRRDSRIMPEIMLMHSSLQRLPMKDFGAEVRASMDVDQFLQQAVLLLDISENSLEGIVDRMLRKVSPML